MRDIDSLIKEAALALTQTPLSQLRERLEELFHKIYVAGQRDGFEKARSEALQKLHFHEDAYERVAKLSI